MGAISSIETDATERTTKIVRMIAPEEAPRRSLVPAHRRSFQLDQAGNRGRIQRPAQDGTRQNKLSMHRFRSIRRSFGQEPNMMRN